MASLKYMPQLDSLRAIAVGLVFLLHFTQFRIVHVLETGYIGVRLFFVLSGFLITLILLRYKEEIAAGQAGFWGMAGKFYTRRFWRIFPPYYAFLAVMVVIGLPTAAEGLGWHLTYTSNIWYFFWPGHFNGLLVHFWSLAVEEQFYLVWPFLILSVPERHVRTAIISTIALGISFRLIGVVGGLSPFQVGVVTPGCADALGFGALLAFARHQSRESLWRGLVRSGYVVGVPLAAAAIWAGAAAESTGNPLLVVFNSTFLQVGVSLTSVAIIAHASKGIGGLVGQVLDSSALQYAGRISYGLYLYHYPMIWIVAQVSESLGIPEPRGALGFAVKVGLTFMVSTASWHFFERPLNGLKDKLWVPRAVLRSA